jgi:GntR family transcriptional regulator
VLSVTFDRGSSVPLYQQLKYHIVHAISTGRTPPGVALPSVRLVSRELGMAPATVQRAYAELQAEAFVVGEPGRGVFVAELDPEHGMDEDSRRQSLRDVLLPAVRQAQSLGFSSGEILAQVRTLVTSERRHAPRIAFVGRRPDAVQKYVRFLRVGLAAIDAEVIGVDLQTFKDTNGAVLDELRPLDLVVSLVSNYSEVRSAARRRNIEAYGLMVELSEETKRAIIELPFDAEVGLLAESVFLSNTRALVEQLRGPTSALRCVTDDDSPESASGEIEGCSVVLHTLGMGTLAADIAPPAARLIELTFLPMQASLAHLAETILSMDRSDGASDRTSSTSESERW